MRIPDLRVTVGVLNAVDIAEASVKVAIVVHMLMYALNWIFVAAR